MGFIDLLKKKDPRVSVQTARPAPHFSPMLDFSPLGGPECALYDQLRRSVPIIDSAILKIMRLTGSFEVRCGDPAAQAALDRFAAGVRVGASQQGLTAFAMSYLDSLLTYGNAVGEVVLSRDRRRVAALYNAPLEHLDIRQGSSFIEAEVCVRGSGGQASPVPYPQLVLFSALNPAPGQALGRSLLQGLPFVASVLLKIYSAMSQNFERMGNLRYAVTYRPGGGGTDRAYAKEIAQSIAKEWSEAMSAAKNGQIRDFVAVGDVDIRVIGADSQMLDTNVPVRQMLEEIVAKLGLPPFMLGLSWSTTERMSRQQADILTSELESYRGILTPVLTKICTLFLRLEGFGCTPEIAWSNISLLDETELANARLTNARAAQIEGQHLPKEGGNP